MLSEAIFLSRVIYNQNNRIWPQFIDSFITNYYIKGMLRPPSMYFCQLSLKFIYFLYFSCDFFLFQSKFLKECTIFLKFYLHPTLIKNLWKWKTLSCQLKFIVGTLGNSLMQKKMPSKFDNLCKVPLHVF